MINNSYDIIVVGAGHAGIEAALAGARLGCRTLFVTLDREKIGYMSCNPAIGGVGKGQLVKEIDALGGEIAKAADFCGIQFRILNASKGSAVQSSRAQVDSKKYCEYMKRVVMNQNNLTVLEAEVTDISVKNNIVVGIELNNNERITAKAVVITPGTFLNGLMHIGMESFPGGRIEDKGKTSRLSNSLRNLEFKILRFKTGTCARLEGKTIDFTNLGIQNGDNPPKPFSFSTNGFSPKQVPCYLTYTTKKTHDIINCNLDRSPLFSGKITGTGVRYCPSLEDKVVKFPHHERHQIFLEPEGLDTDLYYPNGLSTSLPVDVQDEFIRSIPGLEKVKIDRHGYGIEHDIVDSTQLFPTMEAKSVKNLYLAGQINGTTGYEEAAAQGLIAGINAVLNIKGKEHLILDRSTSYIGVLLDDLTTKGTNEPYRMFTSRVEYRLVIREDNADLRLGDLGRNIGLVSEEKYRKITDKKENIERGLKYLKANKIKPKSSLNLRLSELGITPISKVVTLEEFLRRPEVDINKMKRLGLLDIEIADSAAQQIELEVKYEGYMNKEYGRIKRFKELERIRIPEGIDYRKIHSLSNEIIQKLVNVKPISLGQASRISGVTPAALSILMVYLKKLSEEKSLAGNKKTKNSYYKFSDYLKQRFGCKVYKVSVDAGFSCPNRDGKLSREGCIYCDNRGFSLQTRRECVPLLRQIKDGIDFGRERIKAHKFFVYFQAYTNTYDSINILKERYDTVKNFKDIAGISIGTRPDCVNDQVLNLLEQYTKDYEVWLEYGLQTIHDKTLYYINRGHKYDNFLRSLELTRKRGNVKVCVHVIIGLPGETKDDILETAKALGKLKIDGIKIHPLHIVKNTKLADLYRQGVYKPLAFNTYVELASEFLEYLWPETVIQRITAECPKDLLVAPDWILNKHKVLNEIEYQLNRENRFQGKHYVNPDTSPAL